MKLITSIIILLGLIATALCTAVPRTVLPDCTKVNNGTITCASGNIFGNSIFECVDLHWNYIEMCNDPYTHCIDGACVSTSSNQDRNNNNNIDDDDDDDDDLPPVFPHEDATTAAAKCKENELKCLAQNGQGKDGAVYKCTNGFWKMIQDCSSYERCVSKPAPHCAW
ncbi:hypothetical protein TW65_04948 [Stemphylium lycopersici]|uniref:Uncharacterized protein n=1 Tax=Stemphylium lycopersici TaxID=183478 RepID=A0A364N0Q3_STELY|nr:hypothetical protein TW65_04948 [Stemphylium lycopersici]RAR08718.1 hypothetical protein DDE83_005841 [Stemphylium lycopersici]